MDAPQKYIWWRGVLSGQEAVWGLVQVDRVSAWPGSPAVASLVTPSRAVPFSKLNSAGDSFRPHPYFALGEDMMSEGKEGAKRVDKSRDGPQSLTAGSSQLNLNAAGIDVSASSRFVPVLEDRWKLSMRELDAYTADLHPLPG